ncbi:hypothetical protein Acid345_1152 [Candidatus Koribacter versatilis Ellin345]|uniref:Uncharacterized protein n=1 Tax=Koribacter versatilis (strain Ellin345) TaxID=204669 RepID=Q1ISJ5_KORVE|nr:DUF6599 family protein [Candidatus Koribacter versatilis]ABF40155.1 hypothetical protein Acid345_1152 [Candidatus Koribacter versatilis Ellin345]
MNRLFTFVAVLCFALGAFAADPPAPAPLLPQSFAGWDKTQTLKHGNDPAQADAAMPAVLKEYGFHDFEEAQYTRGGRKITIKAARFDNVTGSYGAFTFYRQPEMIQEKIGDDAASANTRILFYRSNVLVDANLDQVTAMSAADLRALAQELPKAAGNDATAPILPGYLPHEKSVQGTLKYVLGPNALTALHAPVSTDQINFEKYGTAAEAAFADYADHGDRSTMVVVSYPTPQIATERLQNFENTMSTAPGFVAKRSGDKVVIMTGNLSSGDEKALVGSVNFDATVSWTEATKLRARDNIGNLVVAMFTLAGILMLVGLIFGVFFGGIRVLFQRILPGRFHKEDEDTIISLDLR